MMARTSKKASPKAAKAKPKGAKAAMKAAPARKAQKRTVAKPRKVAKAAPKRKAPPKPVHDAAHEHHMAEIRQQVARRRPGMAPMVTHGHEQQDASLVPPPPPPPTPPTDTLHQNWGDAKNKAVTRLDKPTNWFRQAPKPKQK